MFRLLSHILWTEALLNSSQFLGMWQIWQQAKTCQQGRHISETESGATCEPDMFTLEETRDTIPCTDTSGGGSMQTLYLMKVAIPHWKYHKQKCYQKNKLILSRLKNVRTAVSQDNSQYSSDCSPRTLPGRCLRRGWCPTCWGRSLYRTLQVLLSWKSAWRSLRYPSTGRSSSEQDEFLGPGDKLSEKYFI